MACTKCKKSPCGCKKNSSGLSPSDQATLSDIQDQLSELNDAAQFLLNGHPILIVEHADDVNQFNLSTGEGLGPWTGWALCNGASYYSSKYKKNITTPDFTDRFVVMAGGEYAVDDIGGQDTVSLTAAQNGQHNHLVSDPGHTHTASEAPHTHGVDEHGGHEHGLAADPTALPSFDTEPVTDHTHQYASPGNQFNTGNSQTVLYAWDHGALSGTSPNGAHSHVVNVPPFTISGKTTKTATGLSIIATESNVTVDPEETGIILGDSGNGDAHENRPPYFSVLFVMRIG